MTYNYTRPEPKNWKIKPAIAVIATTLLAVVAFNLMGSTSKPAPLATQPTAFSAPAEQDVAKAGISDLLVSKYKDVDSAIRDVQMDNAVTGRKIQNAIQSDRNPVRSALIFVDRKSSLMAILVGLAFLFTMVSLGFIRTSKDDDLSNF